MGVIDVKRRTFLKSAVMAAAIAMNPVFFNQVMIRIPEIRGRRFDIGEIVGNVTELVVSHDYGTVKRMLLPEPVTLTECDALEVFYETGVGMADARVFATTIHV